MRVEWAGTDALVHPTGAVRGDVRPPGSKSLTNRYLLCAALADGVSGLGGASWSDDAERMVDGLRRLGVRVDLHEELHSADVHGCRGQLPADEADLDVGAAGTAMRFLTALATLGHGRYRVDGSARMRQRPIAPLVGALQQLGAGIGYDDAYGYPPLTILAHGLAGGQVRIDAPQSSQFVSALLMVAPYAAHDVFLEVAGELPSQPYVEMTVEVMRSMGVEVLSNEGGRYVVPATQRYRAENIEIEPDASAATYFWAAAAITGGSVRVRGLGRGSRQGDVGFVDVLESMGCRIVEGAEFLEVQGPAPGELRGVKVDLNHMPDTVQTLAIAALFAGGPTEVSNVANLRVKETDRLAALAAELTKLGANVDVRADGLTISPPATVTPATIETYDDHRMAMSFALAGLVMDGIVIRDAGCVSKSFPEFFDALNRLG